MQLPFGQQKKNLDMQCFVPVLESDWECGQVRARRRPGVILYQAQDHSNCFFDRQFLVSLKRQDAVSSRIEHVQERPNHSFRLANRITVKLATHVSAKKRNFYGTSVDLCAYGETVLPFAIFRSIP